MAVLVSFINLRVSVRIDESVAARANAANVVRESARINDLARDRGLRDFMVSIQMPLRPLRKASLSGMTRLDFISEIWEEEILCDPLE